MYQQNESVLSGILDFLSDALLYVVIFLLGASLALSFVANEVEKVADEVACKDKGGELRDGVCFVDGEEIRI